MSEMPFTLLLLLLLLLLSALFFSSAADHHRHLLHQPFFPVISTVPPSQSPSSSAEPPSSSPVEHSHKHHRRELPPPPPQENHTSSSSSAASPNSPPQGIPFFPSSDPVSAAPPPPPPLIPATLPTFPANISSLLLPRHISDSKSQHGRHIAKFVAFTTCTISAALLLSLIVVFFIFLRRRRDGDGKSTRSDSLKLFNAAPSDSPLKHKQPPKYTSTNTSSEFLYLGTLVNPRSGGSDQQKVAVSGNVSGVLGVTCPASTSSSSSQYQKLGSPELRPLPPLPKYNVYTPTYQSGEQLNPKIDEGDDMDKVFSPTVSSGRIPTDSMSCSPTTNTRPTSLKPKSPDSIMKNLPAHTRPHDASLSSFPYSSSGFGVTQSSSLHQNSQNEVEKSGSAPQSPPQFLEIPACSSITPARDMSPSPTMSIWIPPLNPGNGHELGEKKEDALKAKLKPLRQDRVRSSSSGVMAWDRIKSSSFQLIDPKKVQNVAVLLKALNVTVGEVCEAISEGNADTLGPELLESLLEIAPTKEEEESVFKELHDDVSASKLGPAENFLKALLDIPYAFKRIDAMFYVVNFESETEYLKKSFDTLEAACAELKSSGMFLKLLEAVLETRDRMNIGTDRCDTHAFKLDTLLKLVDIKGTDGKTTLLHFVVGEVMKSSARDNLELRFRAVSGLGSQMVNVKKAAAMDPATLSDVVITNVVAAGMTKVKEVAEMEWEKGVNESGDRFLESMNLFLNKAEEEIAEIRNRRSKALEAVKEVTEYFHGDSEAHPFHVFLVVRDFLEILDRVCREVAPTKETTVY